jgi:hypothetical protein
MFYRYQILIFFFFKKCKQICPAPGLLERNPVTDSRKLNSVRSGRLRIPNIVIIGRLALKLERDTEANTTTISLPFLRKKKQSAKGH